NPDCTPLVGASVEVWHTNAQGVYSGKTPNTNFCSDGNKTAIAANYFRGIQVSDSSGRLDFDTCFPGWYRSRTIHIHVRIRVTDTDYLTTQFFFNDTIDDDIVSTALLYKDRGARDTSNSTDTVVSADAAPEYCFDVSQMSDGSMQASKVVVVRKNSSDSLCTIPAGSKGNTGGTSNTPPGPTPGAQVAFTPASSEGNL
ncbi:MAG: protocatechuate 3,4-dioxygenase, partial [Cytophagaceae bacterium]